MELFEEIEYNFMITGHTKFSCDRHFGYAKKAYNQSNAVQTYEQVANIIKHSSETHTEVYPVRNLENNTLNIRIFDWKS